MAAATNWVAPRRWRGLRPRLLAAVVRSGAAGRRSPLNGSPLCGVVLKFYMTILHCLANEIYLELLG
jgi:hypothetical protein